MIIISGQFGLISANIAFHLQNLEILWLVLRSVFDKSARFFTM